MKDEWEVEMDRMLDIFEHESESSLRMINRRFEVLGRPFNEEFRQLLIKTSMNRYQSRLQLMNSFFRTKNEEETSFM